MRVRGGWRARVESGEGEGEGGCEGEGGGEVLPRAATHLQDSGCRRHLRRPDTEPLVELPQRLCQRLSEARLQRVSSRPSPG